MAMMSESQQQAYAAQIQRSLPMRLEVWRAGDGGLIEGLYPPSADFGSGPHAEDVPCYAYSRMGVGAGEGERAERTFVMSDWSIHVPFGTDVTERDQLRNVTLHGNVIVAGPLNIVFIANSATHRRIAANEVR